MEPKSIIEKAMADAVAGGLEEEKAKGIFSSVLSQVETGLKEGFVPRTAMEEVVTQRDEIKGKLREAENVTVTLGETQTALDGEKAKVTELEGFKVKAERAEETLKAAYAKEVEGIPEEKLSLIPGTDLNDRYQWVLKAKAQGILADTVIPPVGSGLPGFGGTKSTIKQSELNRLATEDFPAYEEAKKKIASKEMAIADG